MGEEVTDLESEPDPSLEDDPAEPAKPNQTPLIVAGVVVLAVVVGAVAWFAFLQPTEIHGAPEAAISACHVAVRDSLKSPATARFDVDALPHAAQDGDIWIIGGTVDSENGFSALVRNVYVCSALHGQGSEYVGLPLSVKAGNAVPDGLVESLVHKSRSS